MSASPSITITEALGDTALFGQHFRDLRTWQAWVAVFKAIFGLPMTAADLALFAQCTGRSGAPTERAKEAWLIVGRRGGKSRALALIAAFLSALCDWRAFLATGERGYVIIVAADRRQCRTIFRFLHAFLVKTPLLAGLVERETAEEIELVNGITIEVATSSYRTIRGRTVVAALCDELAFWAAEDGSNPASEVIASIRPAMATIPGAMLLVASSPYAKRGPLWDAYRRYFGKPGPVLVWQAPTATMNPALSPDVIAEAYENDPVSAAAEYGAQFRSDLEAFVSAEVIDACTDIGVFERAPMAGRSYFAFVDPSGGGGSDSMTLAVAHQQDGVAVLDLVRERKPPFSPEAVCTEYALALKAYSVSSVYGDRWGGEFPREQFRKHGIEYEVSERPKSELYRDALPLLNSGRVRLLDLPRLRAQLCSLERRTARGGRDSIDHPPGGSFHDDVGNAVTGALVLVKANTDDVLVFDLAGANSDLKKVPVPEWASNTRLHS